LATKIIDKVEVDASQITNDDFDADQTGYIYKINEGYYGAFGCQVMPNCEPKCLPLFADMTNGNEQLSYGKIVGPTADEFDVVQDQCQLKQMDIGSWLIWQNMGAYTMNNCASLDDDDSCDAPEIHYFANEHEWKFASSSTQYIDVLSIPDSEEPESDGEESIDSAIEVDEDPFWIFNLIH